MATFTLKAQVEPTIVAQGFVNNLIGVEVDDSGNLWVTEYGQANDDGVITIIAPDGTQTIFMTGLPSALNPLTGEVAGAFRTYQMPNNKVLIVVGEGPHAMGESLLVVDKSNFTPGTPLTLNDVELSMKLGDHVHDQGLLQSDPYNITWAANGDILVADAGANLILKVEANTGTVSTVASLPPFANPLPFGPPFVDAVPTDIVPKADGSGYYVCQLTGFPFVDGAASIFNLDNSGNLTPWQTGFTLLTDMGYDPKDDNLCVLQFGQFGPVDTTLGFYPGTGKVIKIMPNGDKSIIAEGMIGLNPSFTFDAVGNMYVTDLFGFIYKYDFVSGTGETKPFASNVTASPNPFTERVNLGFELENVADVQANIYDMNGRLVKAFAEQKMTAGQQSLTWEANNAQPGMYFYHLLVDGRVASGLVTLSR